jgi:hypothetical protein
VTNKKAQSAFAYEAPCAFYFLGLLCLCFFVCGKVKEFVQGAKAEDAGEQKDESQNAQDDGYCAGNNSGEI